MEKNVTNKKICYLKWQIAYNNVIQQLLDTKVNKFIFGATTRSRKCNKNKAIITQAEATCVVELSQKTVAKNG